MSLTIKAWGTKIILMAQRAAYIAQEETLLVADLHLAKDATFRSRGVPIPPGSSELTLSRLTQLVNLVTPQRLVILGDLFHGREGNLAGEKARFFDWRERHSKVECHWILGNHDRGIVGFEALCCVQLEVEVAGLRLRHLPSTDGKPTVCGHLHPGFRLLGPGRTSQRCPCFYQTESSLILPAFGEFTGLLMVQPGPSDRVFVTAGSSVFEVPTLYSSRV